MIQFDFLGGLARVVSAIMNVVAGPVLVYFIVVNTSLLVLMCLAGGGVPAPAPPQGLRRS